MEERQLSCASHGLGTGISPALVRSAPSSTAGGSSSTQGSLAPGGPEVYSTRSVLKSTRLKPTATECVEPPATGEDRCGGPGHRTKVFNFPCSLLLSRPQGPPRATPAHTGYVLTATLGGRQVGVLLCPHYRYANQGQRSDLSHSTPALRGAQLPGGGGGNERRNRANLGPSASLSWGPVHRLPPPGPSPWTPCHGSKDRHRGQDPMVAPHPDPNLASNSSLQRPPPGHRPHPGPPPSLDSRTLLSRAAFP